MIMVYEGPIYDNGLWGTDNDNGLWGTDIW